MNGHPQAFAILGSPIHWAVGLLLILLIYILARIEALTALLEDLLHDLKQGFMD
jgi:hypothetical protein